MRKIVLYIVAVLFLIGGIMGLVKSIIPQLDWLSIRYIFGMGATYEHMEYPIYARIYGGIMAIMEIGAAGIIIFWKKRYFNLCLFVLGINTVGCLIAVLLGDLFAIVSLLLRIIPIIFIRKEMSPVFKIPNEEE